MAEKYFHSRGAASYEAGTFDQAIRFFKKALALEEHAYTRRHLGLAYLKKGNLDHALKEMSRAIELAPSNAEYRHERSAMWRLKGDVPKADEDEAAARRLDPFWDRVERIRAAARALQKAFDRGEADEPWSGPRTIDRDLKAIMDRVRASARARAAAVADRSCLLGAGGRGEAPAAKAIKSGADLAGHPRQKNGLHPGIGLAGRRGGAEPIRANARVRGEAPCGSAAGGGAEPQPSCPAYCCYFSEEPFLHGLYIGPWKLQAIRRSLRERGRKEEDSLAKLRFGPEEERLRLIPPHIAVKEAGKRVVFFPKRRDKPLGKGLLKGLPRTIDYREPAWIVADSRPCAFLENKRCFIHNVGDEPSFPACKEFLCLTGYVFLVLDYLGVGGGPALWGRPMEELNRLAVETLLLLAERLYGNEEILRIETAMEETLRRAEKADIEKDRSLLAGLLGHWRNLDREHGRLFASQARLLKKEIRGLFCP